MNGRILTVLATGALATSSAYADASYQDTTQITGGGFVDAIKSVPFLPSLTKKLFEPITAQVMVHGNQLARVSQASTEVIDLDAETVTRLDHEHKTFTVMTFQQMRDAIKDAPKKIEDAQSKMKDAQNGQAPAEASNIHATFEVSVKDPNVSKVINGVTAKEQILITKVILTDSSAPAGKDPNVVTYYLVQEIWTAPEPAEMKAVDEFYRRYGQKLMQGLDTAALMKSLRPMISPNATSSIFASQPALGNAMNEAMQRAAVELAKIQGTRILEVSRFGGEAAITSSNSTSAANPTAAANVASGPGISTGDMVASAASAAADRLGALGSAAQSLFGGLQRNNAPKTPTSAETSTSAGNNRSANNAVVYESTTQKSQFSTAEVPSSAFAVPAGYARIESPPLK